MCKVALILDEMPVHCLACPLHSPVYDLCLATFEGIEWDEENECYIRPDWCPLVELPDYKLVFDDGDWYQRGYNRCLDDILGEEEY